MIEVKNLYKRFDDIEVLKDISTVFEDGKTNLIIGQSGSGKTVLMKNLVGLFDPTEGQILYDGRDFVKMSKKEKVMMRREMGMIFQSAALFDSLTVLENVMFPLDMFSSMNLRERQKRAMDCLDRVNLVGAEEKYPGEISGGMQKRVAIFFFDDQLAHVLEQVAGEDEVREAGVRRVHDLVALPLPLLVALIDKDDILANTHHRIHVVGIDDCRDVKLLRDALQQIVDHETRLRVET